MDTEHIVPGVRVRKSPSVSIYWLLLAVLSKYYKKKSELRKKIDLSAKMRLRIVTFSPKPIGSASFREKISFVRKKETNQG